MEFSPQVIDAVLHAESKALATTGPAGLNVVPVSTIYVVDGQIWLINYFFKKTLQNILENPSVSLVCWKGFVGYQIKGSVSYVTEGSVFENAKTMVAETLPDRIVKGVLVITPEEIYDIAPRA